MSQMLKVQYEFYNNISDFKILGQLNTLRKLKYIVI